MHTESEWAEFGRKHLKHPVNFFPCLIFLLFFLSFIMGLGILEGPLTRDFRFTKFLIFAPLVMIRNVKRWGQLAMRHFSHFVLHFLAGCSLCAST